MLLFYVLGKTTFFTVPIKKRWSIFCLGIQIYWCLYQSKNSQDITIYINAQLSISNDLIENLSCSLGLINHEIHTTIIPANHEKYTKKGCLGFFLTKLKIKPCGLGSRTGDMKTLRCSKEPLSLTASTLIGPAKGFMRLLRNFY